MSIDFSDIRGVDLDTLDALIMAAAAGLNILVIGPPDCGATAIARRLPGIMPELTQKERADLAFLYAAAGLNPERAQRRPFRAPHHTCTARALSGEWRRDVDTLGLRRTRPLLPGELSLAHAGVLYLDEIDSFGVAACAVISNAIGWGKVCLTRTRNMGPYAHATSFVDLPAQPRCVVARLHDPGPEATKLQRRAHMHARTQAANMLGRHLVVELPACTPAMRAHGIRWPSTKLIRNRVVKLHHV